MEKYGFVLLSRNEAKHIGLPESSGMFGELYNMMLNEIDKDPNLKKDYKDAPFMTDFEKDISFLNRYFVYKKIRSINAEKLTRAILDNLPDEYEFEENTKMLARESVKKAEEEMIPKAKKLKDKLRLQEATEALEEIVPAKAKKTTRKKKAVELDIIET